MILHFANSTSRAFSQRLLIICTVYPFAIKKLTTFTLLMQLIGLSCEIIAKSYIFSVVSLSSFKNAVSSLVIKYGKCSVFINPFSFNILIFDLL